MFHAGRHRSHTFFSPPLIRESILCSLAPIQREVFLTRPYSLKKEDHGSWIMDQRSWIMDQGSRILDLGPCSGMNHHPGRDTDVRSRPSESTIKDLSFYIGFIRIRSFIKHFGPCFGMNGNFRRDPDVISRLPDTTIHVLSVFIGFEC